MTLTDGEAQVLRDIGKALASQTRWWGSDDEPDEYERTVVRCTRVTPGRYRVVVADAIGAIGVGDLQLIVEPKIPLAHLVYLLSKADQVPRLAPHKSSLQSSDNFFELIARWFATACETLLRVGLLRDYERVSADLRCARGRVNVLVTAQSVQAGRPVIRCDFEGFDEDTSLNRTLKAAALRLLGIRSLPSDVRRRCRRIHQRLENVGDLRPNDLYVMPDRRSHHYVDAHRLAHAVLSSTAIDLSGGGLPSWTFLFRTPEAVEEGVRQSLREHLGDLWRIQKTGKSLSGSRNRRLNPDLVIDDDHAVGDVKYHLTNSGEISRTHLNQVTTFATGYRSRRATVVAFGSQCGEEVVVGTVRVNGFNWDTSTVDPSEAAATLAARVRLWLAGELEPA